MVSPEGQAGGTLCVRTPNPPPSLAAGPSAEGNVPCPCPVPMAGLRRRWFPPPKDRRCYGPNWAPPPKAMLKSLLPGLMTVTLFGNRVSEDVMKVLVKMTSYWRRWALIPCDCGPHSRDRRREKVLPGQRQRRTTAGPWPGHSQDPGHQQKPDGQGRALLRVAEAGWPRGPPDFGPLPPGLRESQSRRGFRPLGCGALLRRPWEAEWLSAAARLSQVRERGRWAATCCPLQPRASHLPSLGLFFSSSPQARPWPHIRGLT